MKHSAVSIPNVPNSDHSTCATPITQWSGTDPQTKAPWTVYCGDARKIISRLAAGRYSCVITSPPYFWQRDYGVEGQIGVEQTPTEYVTAICEVMDGVREVLMSNGVLFLILGDTYYSGKGQPQGHDRKHNGRRFPVVRAVDASGLGPPKKTLLGMPWRVALAMIDRGWVLRSSIIWRRENALPEPNVRDRPWRTYEFVYLFVKSRRYNFSREPLRTVREEDLWTIESQSQAGREHPAVFPPELVDRCLAVGNPGGGPVLDPFSGSGTVLKVALRRGMPADGIDLSPVYCHSIARGLTASAQIMSG